jgi:hypothetical protein
MKAYTNRTGAIRRAAGKPVLQIVSEVGESLFILNIPPDARINVIEYEGDKAKSIPFHALHDAIMEWNTYNGADADPEPLVEDGDYGGL